METAPDTEHRPSSSMADSDLQYTQDTTDVEAFMRRLDAGELLDFSMLSSKQVWRNDSISTPGSTYVVTHLIDGTQTEFTREGIVEALQGHRAWRDGDA